MFNNTKISIWWLIVLFMVMFSIIKQCEGEPKTTVETTIDIKKVIDSVKSATIKNIKSVHIDTSKKYTKWLKGETIYKDSIIYRDNPTETTITANQYDTEIKSDSATAKLKITTTGELLDVKGLIEYPRIETTTTITKTRDASGFFIYASMPVNGNVSPELGGMIQIKNKIILGAGAQYNNFTKKIDAKITLAVKI